MENTNTNVGGNETVVNQPNGTTQETTTQERVPVQLKDDDLIPLQINGETVYKPYKEARDGFMRHEDYTRKTQSTAARIKEVQDLYDSLQGRDTELKARELMVDRLLGRTPKEEKADLNDDDVMTVKQFRQALEDHKNGIQTDLTKTLETFGTRQKEAATYERWDNLIGETVKALGKEHPLLAKVPHLDAILKREAQKDQPRSEEDLLAAVLKAGKKMAQEFDTHYTEQRKAEAVRKKNLTEKGPEPRGGVTQFTTKKDYTKSNGRKIDWKGIEEDVIAALENQD